jgi:DNA-binding response OmpR family regulator
MKVVINARTGLTKGRVILLKPGIRHRILIVEDDESCAAMYRRALRFSGFDVDIAADGLTALVTLEQRRPDLVVLDLSLPHLDGQSVLTEITSRPDLHDIPVVIVTGSDATFAASDAAAVLRKPCDPDRLVEIIAHQLDPAA